MTTIITLIVLYCLYKTTQTRQEIIEEPHANAPVVPRVRMRKVEELTFLKNPRTGRFEPTNFTRTNEVLNDTVC